MNINTVIEYLNKQRGYDLSGAYYSDIHDWTAWWKGFYKPFHEFVEVNGEQPIKRQMYTLKMAKKVCEDWASILLNEKTEIVMEDKTSSEFVQGKDGTGGILAANDFWEQGNALVEKAFYSGTGAFVVKLDGLIVNANDGSIKKDNETVIRIEYLPAQNIIPLTIRHGQIVDIAFVSEILNKGKKFIYLEMHILSESGYQITNQYFREEEGTLLEEPLPEGIAPSLSTGSDIPLFSIVYPNIVNNIDDSTGLGISVYANAIDNLMGVDLAYNNFNRDIKLGGKKVFYNDSLLKRDKEGRAIAPDDVMQQLFVSLGDSDLDDATKLIQEFNPSLRVGENKDGIQGQLDYLSFKCGLGTKHYQFNSGSILTATQYTGDKQELIQNASKHYIIVERALKDLVKAILWAGKEVIGASVNPEALVTNQFLGWLCH